MIDSLLVLNAGSSSIKFAVFTTNGRDQPQPLARGQVSGIGVIAKLEAKRGDGTALHLADGGTEIPDHATALSLLLDRLADAGLTDGLAAAGHRVVHGGSRFAAPVVIDEPIIEALAKLIPLAPLHQPHNIAAIRALRARLPELPQVACFDTAFHATQPPEAARFALPLEFWERGLRRYGFHGLSYESVTTRFPQIAGAPLPPRTIVAHLGNGASLCAVKDGRSVATTMGFSTLDGLIMGTRGGDMDAGLLLHLMREDGYDRAALEALLYHKAGLLGLSGLSPDMRLLLASEAPESKAAIAQYCYRISRHIGSLAAALEGLGALIFTAGIGENAAAVRESVCRAARWLGVELDESTNRTHGPRISTPDSRVSAWVIPTDEELVIARHARDVLGRA
jgi:acetate kinase